MSKKNYKKYLIFASITCSFFIIFSLFFLLSYDKNAVLMHGYVEGNFLRLSSPIGGLIETLNVVDGQKVKKGDLLFQIEKKKEESAVAELQAKINAEKTKLDNLRKITKRKKILSETGGKSIEEYETSESNVEQLTHMIDGMQSDLDKAAWNVTQKDVFVPCDATVVQTHYKIGEYVNISYPVVTLLPHAGLKVKFFISFVLFPQITPNMPVIIHANNIELKGKISFIKEDAEYTPPVLYTKEQRDRLVYMVEVLPHDNHEEWAKHLKPGQPIDVELQITPT